MLNYSLTMKDILEMAPQQVEFLMAGLLWTGRATVTVPKNSEEKQQEEWEKVVKTFGIKKS